MRHRNTTHTADILKLFYRTQLRWEEDVIDNRDITIAKELGLAKETVCRTITYDLEAKANKLNLKINETDEN